MKQQPEFPLEGEGIPQSEIKKAEIIMRLMASSTSLSVVGEFLKQKGLHFSAGSWEEMREKRILPSLRNGKLTVADLGAWIAEVEEFGRAHVFLYRADPKDVQSLISRDQIVKTCSRLGLSSVLQDVIIEDFPTRPKITQIREEQLNGVQTWIFKIVETREEKVFQREVTEGDLYRREYKIERMRAVNICRLHANGLLEIRVQSHTGSSKYKNDIEGIWSLLQHFLPPTKFKVYSLSSAKDKIWENQNALKKTIRFSDSRMTNPAGTTLTAATGSENDDLCADSAATKSMAHFLLQGGHCESSNIWFRKVDQVLTREIHVLLSGERNEFAVTASCMRSEYEYVLNELRTHSK